MLKRSLAKAAGAEVALQQRMKNGALLWREARCQVRIHKTRQARSHFEIAIRNNGTPLWREAHLQVKTHKTPHAWSLFALQIARSCGAKPICKSKRTKHHMLGPLFALQMSKNRTQAVARSPFASQNGQNTSGRDRFWMLRSGKWNAAVAQSAFVSQNAQNTTCSDHFLNFSRKIARRCGAKRVCKSKCSKTAQKIRLD